MRGKGGFTLVELITVIVVLSIVAAIGSGFVVTAVDSYRDTQERAKLVQKGRLAIEQMTRQLRIALPHSPRVSTSGNCIEFIPIVGSATYLERVPDQTNGLSPISSIKTSPVNLPADPIMGPPQYIAIGGKAEDEIYNTSAISSIVEFDPGGITPGALPSSPTTISFASGAHTFVRNSINNRLFITSSPRRFCVAGNSLVEYSGYSLDAGSLEDDSLSDPILLADSVAVPTGSKAFELSPGSEDRHTAVHINLRFQQGGSSVELNHQVLVRNVP